MSTHLIVGLGNPGAEYEATRGWLRAVLGACLGVEPAGLRFAYGEHGKPALDGVTPRLKGGNHLSWGLRLDP